MGSNKNTGYNNGSSVNNDRNTTNNSVNSNDEYAFDRLVKSRREQRDNKKLTILGMVGYTITFAVIQLIVLWCTWGSDVAWWLKFLPLEVGVGFYGITLIIDLITLIRNKLKSKRR